MSSSRKRKAPARTVRDHIAWVTGRLVRYQVPGHLSPVEKREQLVAVGTHDYGPTVFHVPYTEDQLVRRKAVAIFLQRTAVDILAPCWIEGRISSGAHLKLVARGDNAVDVLVLRKSGRWGAKKPFRSWEGEDAFDKADAWLRQVIETDKTHYWKSDPVLDGEPLGLKDGDPITHEQYAEAYQAQAIRNYETHPIRYTPQRIDFDVMYNELLNEDLRWLSYDIPDRLAYFESWLEVPKEKRRRHMMGAFKPKQLSR